MANPLLGQILGSVFANAMRGRARGGPFAGGLGTGGGGGLGDLLGGMLGRGSSMGGQGVPIGGRAGGGFGGRGALLALMLPLAMQWVQRNGGIGAVLDRFKQKGYRPQADSWVATGPNHMLDPGAVDDVIGSDELSRLAQQLGVPQEEIASGFAEILPEMVDQLSPQGQIPAEADDALDAGQSELARMISDMQSRQHA